MQRRGVTTIATLLALMVTVVTAIHGDHLTAMSNIPNATIPDGKYRISVGETGVGRGNFLFVKKTHEQATDIAKRGVPVGAALGVGALLLASRFGAVITLGSLLVSSVAGGMLMGGVMLPFGYLTSVNQLELAVDRSDVFEIVPNPHEDAPNVIQLNQLVGMTKFKRNIVVDASMMRNYHLTDAGQPNKPVPTVMIAKQVVNPSIVVPSHEYLVYLQYYTAGLDGAQWIYALDGKFVATSATKMTAWRFTPALEFNQGDTK